MKEIEFKAGLSISLPQSLYKTLKEVSEREGRSLNKQIIHYIKLGMTLDREQEIKMQLLLKQQLQ